MEDYILYHSSLIVIQVLWRLELKAANDCGNYINKPQS